MFDTEFKFFVDNQDELVEKHRGKVLVLHGPFVASVHSSLVEAYGEGLARFGAGNFMLQRCEPGPEAYTVRVSSLNLFPASGR